MDAWEQLIERFQVVAEWLQEGIDIQKMKEENPIPDVFIRAFENENEDG